MVKKKVEKTLTIEEKLEQEKQRGINMIKREVPFLSEPTYSFSVGDKVGYGCLKQCVVDDVMYDGKVYGLKCIATDNNYGKPYDYETYRVASWVSVRPLEFGNTNFSKNQDVKIYFNNTTIEGLMHHHYHFGIDFEPDYQRGYIWEQEDKEFLLDSIFNNIDIGKFVLIRLSDEEWGERGLSYEILDGKQRLSTIIEFYENRLSYKGKFYNELGSKDRNVFKQHNVSFAEVDNVDKKSILKYFLMLNRTGKAIDKAHLESVESLLKDMEKSR